MNEPEETQDDTELVWPPKLNEEDDKILDEIWDNLDND